MRKASLLLSILVISLFALSCSEDQPTYPQWWLSATSPYNTLSDLECCFNSYEVEPNVTKLLDLIIADDFIFYFDHDDIGDVVGGYTIPAYWGRGEFMQVINNMFNQAYSIDFRIPILGQGEDAFGKPAEGDTTFTKDNVTISLTVMVDPTNGYIATGFCDFAFSKGSDGFWRLSEWRDHNAKLLCTSQSSFGHILALFH
jgi:hypothetical protein